MKFSTNMKFSDLENGDLLCWEYNSKNHFMLIIEVIKASIQEHLTTYNVKYIEYDALGTKFVDDEYPVDQEIFYKNIVYELFRK